MKMGAGAGLLFISPLREHMRYAIHLHFPASNNMAEYKALLCGLRIAIETSIKRLDVRRDSQLVIDQVMKSASCHDNKMEAYHNAVRALEDKFYSIELNHVPRRYNEEADKLAKIAPGRITVPPNVFMRDVAKPFVNLESTPSNQEEPSGLPRVRWVRNLWMMTPRTRCLCSPCLRATGQTMLRPWTQSQPPRGGLAGQILCLDGSRGTTPGSVQG
jgi:ribonuclease HI